MDCGAFLRSYSPADAQTDGTRQHLEIEASALPHGSMVNAIDCLAVKIILLGLASGTTPERPKDNAPLAQHTALDARRKLSFKQELCIVEQLAFVCSYSSDPQHVLAVCVEEAAARNGLSIRFAFNSGSHQALVDSLERMARILENEAAGGACLC